MDRGNNGDVSAERTMPVRPVRPVRPDDLDDWVDPTEPVGSVGPADPTEPVGSVGPAESAESADEEIAGERAEPRGHRRGPGLWFPLIVLVALLAGGAAVGRFVVPAGGPDTGSEPPAQAITPGGSVVTPPPATVGPDLPTTPVRPADQLAAWAEKISAAVDVPVVAIQAYGYAQLSLQQTDPACRLGWTTLAGIAEVESRHGQAGGAVLEANGRSSPTIIGPLLDGKDGRALVSDTDAGAFDGDATFDRAMGPMHMTPSTWRSHAIDADSDGIVDPFDLDDAALTLGRLLCSGPEDLTQREGWNDAVSRYRGGNSYVRSVFEAADSYGQRTRDIV